ncbi:hypothetical protein [Candidatus Nitrotoga arctica]|nr:hypothetical protein [Candidatus Nitrotoga arctica]
MAVHENPHPPNHSFLVRRNLAHVPLGAVQVIRIPIHLLRHDRFLLNSPG